MRQHCWLTTHYATESVVITWSKRKESARIMNERKASLCASARSLDRDNPRLWRTTNSQRIGNVNSSQLYDDFKFCHFNTLHRLAPFLAKCAQPGNPNYLVYRHSKFHPRRDSREFANLSFAKVQFPDTASHSTLYPQPLFRNFQCPRYGKNHS